MSEDIIEEVEGDLLEVSGSIAHSVAEDLQMRAGLAKKIFNKFNSLEELKEQKKGVGECAVLSKDDRYIYYLITKKKARDQPKLVHLKSSLLDMSIHALSNEVSVINMPRIGCGLDKLNWDDVKKVIIEIFEEENIKVRVFSFKGDQDSKSQPSSSKNPIPQGDGNVQKPAPSQPTQKQPTSQGQEQSANADSNGSPALPQLISYDRHVTIINGDLFQSQGSLAHCVSADLNMSKGIAKIFKNRFQRVNDLKNQNPQVGNLCVLKEGDRYIYYLITKDLYYKKPTYDTLKSSLDEMKSHAVKNNVNAISMPQIGCGLDKLDWKKVLECLHDLFDSTNIQIIVYILKKDGNNAPSEKT